jgi:hypothetical protein
VQEDSVRKDKDKGRSGKKVKAVATKLAITGMGAGVFNQQSAEELAEYCLDVAIAIEEFDYDDNGDEDDDDGGDDD